jgi:hypothetical protein
MDCLGLERTEMWECCYVTWAMLKITATNPGYMVRMLKLKLAKS